MQHRLRVSDLLIKAIEGFESRMGSKDFKPTIAEYLKLLQMQQDFNASDTGAKEIKVTWVDPAPTSEPEK